jgi:sugar transferase (PEP-CTERM/EpsH1 system associated)
MRPPSTNEMTGQETANAARTGAETKGDPCARRQTAHELIRGTRKVRILHVLTYLGLGGTELAALRIIGNLDPRYFENLVCGVRGFDAQVAKSRWPGIDVIVPSQKGGTPSISALSLLKVIKDCKPDIVHSRNWGAIESVPAAWFAKVPRVIHSEHGYEMDTLTKLPVRRRIFRRAVYGLADAIFTVTGELRNFHARQAWVSPDRIRVISNGVDTEAFIPKPYLKRSICDQMQVPSGRFVIGSLGRMVPIKNHEAILRAAETLLQNGCNIHILLVGSGPELQRHKEYVKSSTALTGRVTFLGATEATAEALNAMDVFVLPSFSEGMSNTLLEAMACGLAVAATRVGGNPEVVEEGRSGLLFAPGNVDELADCLRRLQQDHDLRTRLGEAARRRILERFDLKRMVKEYSDLYLELAITAGIPTRTSS